MISLSTLVFVTIVDCTRCGEEHLPNLSGTFSPDFPILLILRLALKAPSLLHLCCYAILVPSCIIRVAARSIFPIIYIHVALLISYLIHTNNPASHFLRPSYLISF